MIPSVLSIQDFCSMGRCALTVTIPVLSAQGVQAVALPTSLFSNTPFFPHMTVKELIDESYAFLKDWKANAFQFQAIQSGFLASPAHTGIVTEAIRLWDGPDVLTVVDPAMADHGSLYPVFHHEMVTAMKDLIRVAKIITPNYTEACMLTDRTYSAIPIENAQIHTLCQDLAKQGPSQIVITSVPYATKQSQSDIIATAVYDARQDALDILTTARLPINAPGTGDIFTAILTGSLLKGHSLISAAERAMQFTYRCLDHTYKAGANPLMGVLLEDVLSYALH